eukprot:CAMPEP_0182913282 /NCGR_PEP_ID=MMETSP0034_2-20130328/37955_1 /TAXON_ID=156128 /ORGANISM="Nephroselmis pyriformis, Strain CCMP717" /LENGTH=804 /DNA_ID=CAMNT_0025049997 /DNA_START=28 /DNA_END=2442 /DNA_ORIENTATION=+
MKEVDITPLMVVSVPFLGGVIAMFMIGLLLARLKAASPGEDKNQLFIAAQISEGAVSFLKTEYSYLVPFVVACAVFLVAVLESQDNKPMIGSLVASSKGGWQTMICFICGAILSAAAGWCGMKVATEANVKTMEAAKTGLNPALKVAFAGGAVMGFTVVGFGILGLTALFFIFSFAREGADEADVANRTMQEAIRYLSGFAFGASSIALFARVAGGIYTKAADVGADLVGKVESNIPEDDPRNPATIADNVGDNVGDVAGMGADLFESFVGSIIATAYLADSPRQIALPMWIAGFGIFAAAVGFFVVKTKDDASQKDLLHSLHAGMYVSSALVIGLSALAVHLIFEEGGDMHGNRMSYSRGVSVCQDCVDINGNKFLCLDGTATAGCTLTDNLGWEYFGCIIIGLVAGILIGEATEYFTSYAYRPTQSITEAGSMGGAATVIIQGLGIGMFSCVPPTIIIAGAVIACYELGNVYGIAIAAVGMLSTLGVTLATDAYGPVADNAGGIAEMTPGVPEEVRERTDRLDALGNTTAATGKGFAIGSAVLTALTLMAAFVENVPVKAAGGGNLDLPLTNPLVLSGVIVGSMLPFLFGALTMLSVRKAAGAIIVEVQHQFRTIDGLLEGREGVKCDHMRCVALCTASSVKEMILPGVIAVLCPIAVGLLIGARALGGLLVGSISSGFMLALMMSNAGGAWDNSKKYIENEGVFGGKKSDTHKAVVVGDTVGDPFKDTSGPALNILIKLMSVFSLTLAPVFRDDWGTWWEGLIMVAVLIVALAVSYWYVWLKDEDPLAKTLEERNAAGNTA